MSEWIADFDEPRWFVCYTRPRCEKKFSAMLRMEQFEHYLPLVRKASASRPKSRSYEKPLFTGYVFTHIAPHMRARVYQQDLLVRAIWIEDQALFIRQLDHVRRVVEAGLTTTLHPLLKKGILVRINSGPLRGVEGYVENPDSPRGILVAIDVLQRGLLINVPPEQLKVLD